MCSQVALLVQPDLRPTLVLMFISGNYSLAEEYPHFPYQVHSPRCILYLPRGTVVPCDMTHTHFQHLLAGVTG